MTKEATHCVVDGDPADTPLATPTVSDPDALAEAKWGRRRSLPFVLFQAVSPRLAAIVDRWCERPVDYRWWQPRTWGYMVRGKL